MALNNLIRLEIRLFRDIFNTINASFSFVQIQVLILQADRTEKAHVGALGTAFLTLSIGAHVLPNRTLFAEAASVIVSRSGRSFRPPVCTAIKLEIHFPAICTSLVLIELVECENLVEAEIAISLPMQFNGATLLTLKAEWPVVLVIDGHHRAGILAFGSAVARNLLFNHLSVRLKIKTNINSTLLK